jgi:hypothetical protein
MKRILVLAVPFVILVGVALTFIVLEGRRTPDWESVLDDYIAGSHAPGETIDVLAMVQARKPWNFTPSMGRAVRSDWKWQIVQLPFPPTELRCVLLERRGGSATGATGEGKRQVVYVGYHTDALWRLGWLVHEGPQGPFTAPLLADLEAIGCDLDVE